jgi:hypothetical protein
VPQLPQQISTGTARGGSPSRTCHRGAVTSPHPGHREYTIGCRSTPATLRVHHRPGRDVAGREHRPAAGGVGRGCPAGAA